MNVEKIKDLIEALVLNVREQKALVEDLDREGIPVCSANGDFYEDPSIQVVHGKIEDLATCFGKEIGQLRAEWCEGFYIGDVQIFQMKEERRNECDLSD